MASTAAAEIAAAAKARKENQKTNPIANVNTGFNPLPAPSQPSPPAPGYPVGFPSNRGGRTRRRFKKKRLMSRKYCKKTPCRRMGFTQKASCRPYKNCYTRRK
jgi:hypothetical protein